MTPAEIPDLAISLADIPNNIVSGTSDLDLAKYVHKQLKKSCGEISPVKVGSTVYLYQPETGLWNASTDAALLRRHIHQLDGKYYRKTKGEVQELHPLKLSSRMCSGIQKELEYVITDSSFFDSVPLGIHFTNGFLNERFELEPHKPEHKATASIGYDYDPNAKAPRFSAFLNDVFSPDDDRSERIKMLMEFYGACLMGEAPKYQKSVYMFGAGEDGKSTLQDIAAGAIGDHLSAAVPPDMWVARFGLADLQGKRLNSIAEMPTNEMARTDRFKAIITGDPVPVERKYKDGTKVRMIAGHIFSANRIPVVNDTSKGYWRRITLLRFSNSYTGRAQVGLAESILAEEKQGILNMMIEGAKRLRLRGKYTHVPSSDIEAQRAQVANDSVAQFIEEGFERIEFGNVPVSSGIPAATLYKDYRSWATENGIPFLYLVKASTFRERLETMKITQDKSSRLYWALKRKCEVVHA